MIFSITSNVMQPVFGYFIDRQNWNHFLLSAIPFGALAICSLGFLDSKFTLFLLVALTGFSVSLYHPLGLSMVSHIIRPEKLGLALSIFVGGGNVGFAVAPLFLVIFLEHFTIEEMPLLVLPTLLLSFLVFLTKLYKLKKKDVIASSPSEMPLGKILRQKNLLKLNLAMGLRCWTHGAVTMFLPILLISNGYSSIFSGIMLTIFLAGAALGGLYGGYLGDKIGYKKVILLSLALGTLPTSYFFAASDINALTLAALFLCGAGLQTAAPGSIVWAQHFMRGYEGIASGMMLGLAFGIGGIGSAITGALGDIIGIYYALCLTVVPLAVSALIVYTIPES
jgi:FSR family fosmidomycin resistance protein-like MFS transporter